LIQNVKPPFGIVGQASDNVLCQISVDAKGGFARGLIVVQDIVNSGKFGELGSPHLEYESRHYAGLSPRPRIVCTVQCLVSNIAHMGRHLEADLDDREKLGTQHDLR
jgi:hypothetical protein